MALRIVMSCGLIYLFSSFEVVYVLASPQIFAFIYLFHPLLFFSDFIKRVSPIPCSRASRFAFELSFSCVCVYVCVCVCVCVCVYLCVCRFHYGVVLCTFVLFVNL